MTELYNHWNDRCSWLINQPLISYRFKLEILDHHERSYGEITRDVSSDEHFTINVNKSQGIRRTCTITIIDLEKAYLPSINNPFWYNRKFKLYLGIVDNVKQRTYWYPQGIYVCQNASATRSVVHINGVDKFAFLDGTLNVHMLHEGYVAEAGSKIGEFVRQTLMIEMGNGFCIDPIVPIIDHEFESLVIPADITLAEGQYVGEALTQIASTIGANIYYDVDGRLNLTRIFNDDVPFYYVYRGELWHFDDIHENYIEPNVSYELDGCNYVVVSTDNDEGEVATYTAVNDNPESPICVSSVGYRGDKDNPISYIQAPFVMPVIEDVTSMPTASASYADVVVHYTGDTTVTYLHDAYYVCRGRNNSYSWRLTNLASVQKGVTDKNTEYCRQYAEYVLAQKTCPTVAISFKTPIIPILDVGEIVTISDEYFGCDNQPFLIESITIDGVGSMTLSVVNIQWLPNQTEALGAINTSNSGSAISYTVAYSATGVTDLGNTVTSPNTAPSSIISAMGGIYHLADGSVLNFTDENEGKEYQFMVWVDEVQYAQYNSGDLYSVYGNVTLKPYFREVTTGG